MMPCSMECPFGQFRSAALVLPLPNSLCALSSLAGRIVWETEKLLSKKLKHWYAIIMAFFFFFFPPRNRTYLHTGHYKEKSSLFQLKPGQWDRRERETNHYQSVKDTMQHSQNQHSSTLKCGDTLENRCPHVLHVITCSPSCTAWMLSRLFTCIWALWMWESEIRVVLNLFSLPMGYCTELL